VLQGDFALIDNLAVAHFAAPGTQRAAGEAGLRVLHRTTVAGDAAPVALLPRLR
jgi:taurine dioxygenase